MKDTTQTITKIRRRPAETSMVVGFRLDACIIPFGSPLSQVISATAGPILFTTIMKPNNPRRTATCMMCLRAEGLASAAKTNKIRTKPMREGMKAVKLFLNSRTPLLGGLSRSMFFQFDILRVAGPLFPAALM